jgi:DNA ligase-1
MVITSLEALLQYEEECLELGYEGLILRDPRAPYKMGRSTVKEGYLLKLKRFMDAEATIVDCFEREHNGNEAKTDELGRTKRSSHKSGKTGRGDLGGFVLRTSEGVQFSCGTGFSDAERAEYWANRDQVVGRIAKYKYFPVGVKDAPRHPVFLGWRDERDM